MVIKYARRLDDRDLAGTSDPYTTITAYTPTGYSSSGRTHHIRGDESPDWNYVFNAGCYKQWTKFYFKVYDSDIIGGDDALSYGQYVYLTTLFRLPTCRHTVSLVDGGRGTTTLHMPVKDVAKF